MNWIFTILNIIISYMIYTYTEDVSKPVAKTECDIPLNDSVLFGLKGKLFTCQLDANMTYYFSVCGVTHPTYTLSGPLILLDGLSMHDLTERENQTVKIPPSSNNISKASQRILILHRQSSFSVNQLVYIYFRCGHTETLSPLIVESETDQSSIFEATLPNLCDQNQLYQPKVIHILNVVLLVFVTLGVLFSIVVNKTVRKLPWVESIPLISACCQVRKSCQRRLLLRRANLTEPRYIRVPQDSPKQIAATTPRRLDSRHPASDTQPVLVTEQDSQDEYLLSC